MTTRLLHPQVTVEIDGDDFVVLDGTDVTLDAWAVPYAQATVELPLLDDATLATLDPRTGARVVVSGGMVGDTPRLFDLGVRARDVNHAGKTVTVELAGDEALLQDYAPLEDDWTPLGLASSLRDVIDYVLGTAIPGAGLEAGTDADVTPIWSVSFGPGNSGFDGGSTAGYVAGLNISGLVITNVAGFYSSPPNAVRYQVTAAGSARLDIGLSNQAFPARPGTTYTVGIKHRSSIARDGILGVRWVNGDGDTIGSDTVEFASSSTQLDQFSITAKAPAGAAFIWPYIITLANSASQFHYLDDVMIVEGEFLPDYFDGDTTDTATYEYSWAGNVNSSVKIRKALVDGVTPDALVWRAGVTAWEFLQPLCTAVGMVLWCDESRNWWLQTPEDRTTGNLISVTASTARTATDRLSRDDTDNYVTGVVCRYRWTDRDGIQQERLDTAGTPGKVYVRDFDKPYPGPGAAAQILARRQGTGRVQEAAVYTRWDTSPGDTANITLPGAPDTTGRVASVRFYTDGFMDLGHSGLVDVIPGSIATLTGTIADLTGTISSL